MFFTAERIGLIFVQLSIKNCTMKFLFSPVFAVLMLSCVENGHSVGNTTKEETTITDIAIIDPNGTTIETRFSPPEGFSRVEVQASSFANYLRQLPIKPAGAKALYYNGSEKTNDVYDAVIDLPIGKRDLHQCADAIMRLRAEYLWNEKKYDQIHFNFTNGFRVDYSKWMKGKRVGFSGNQTFWKDGGRPSVSYASFWSYMELIFSYAGTLSLSKEMKSKDIKNMKIGDVFIEGGSPGHAVIVVDMAMHDETGEQLFLLAQSYMPAQETHVLKNPSNKTISPWYSLDGSTQIYTPEWTFNATDLREFVE